MRDFKSPKFRAKVAKIAAELAKKTPGEWHNYYSEAFMELALKQNLLEKVQGWFRVMADRYNLRMWTFQYKNDPLLMVYHIIFRFYYKRVPPYYRCMRIIKSIDTLIADYLDTFSKAHPKETSPPQQPESPPLTNDSPV